MKAIYILDFGTYYAMQVGGLTFDRIGKTPLVKITRNREDLSFLDHFEMIVFGKIGRYFSLRANTIEYNWRVMAGFEKDIQWRKQADGTFFAYDKKYDIEMPHLVRKEPPPQLWKKAIVKKGRK